MQCLTFEKAWKKTIDPDDKQQIVKVFEQANEMQKPTQKFVPLWQARNHRGDLLVTVIVQNIGDSVLTLDNVVLTYYEAGLLVAAHTFAHSHLTIESKFSMPWTFIFPGSKVMREPRFEDSYIGEDETFF